jgi:muramidase (phage lysozyme)
MVFGHALTAIREAFAVAPAIMTVTIVVIRRSITSGYDVVLLGGPAVTDFSDHAQRYSDHWPVIATFDLP